MKFIRLSGSKLHLKMGPVIGEVGVVLLFTITRKEYGQTNYKLLSFNY